MQSHAQSEGSGGFWRPAALAGVVFGIIGFYDPAKDIYARFFDPDYNEVESVALAKQQQRLQQKNLLCAINMTRRAAQADPKTTIRYGVCENRDMLVEVYPQGQPAFQQWISPEYVLSDTRTAKSTGLFFSAVFAAASPQSAIASAETRSAQMELKTLCQRWQDDTRQVRMIRVTNEGGKCFRERINVLSGRVEIREEVPCDTPCDVKNASVDYPGH
jgi:hypothetical protein